MSNQIGENNTNMYDGVHTWAEHNPWTAAGLGILGGAAIAAGGAAAAGALGAAAGEAALVDFAGATYGLGEGITIGDLMAGYAVGGAAAA